MKRFVAVAVLGLFATVALASENSLVWPGFRGPNGSGIAENQSPPVEFGPDKNVKWKVPAPSGFSSPIVAGDLLVITAFENDKLYTIAYRRADGTEAWRAQAPAKELEPFNKQLSSPAASTPATDGQRIVSYFGSCGLFGYDLTGKELWKFELPPALTAGNFGSGVSPIIADGIVILVRDETKDPKIIALDAATGALKWERKRPSSTTSYCTPVIWDTPHGKQVAAAGHARMVGYDLKTGAEEWTLPGIATGSCASPVIAAGTLYYAGFSPGGPDDPEWQMPTFAQLLQQGDADSNGALSREEAGKTPFGAFFDSHDADKDGSITSAEWDVILKFVAEGVNRAFALRAGGKGDISTSHIIWEKSKGLPYVASVLVYRDQFITVKDGGIVTALDTKTGAQVYRERAAAEGSYYASPVAANGNVYLASLDGVITVLKAGAAKAEVVAQNKIPGEHIPATPAIADNRLYIRTDKHLYAFGT